MFTRFQIKPIVYRPNGYVDAYNTLAEANASIAEADDKSIQGFGLYGKRDRDDDGNIWVWITDCSTKAAMLEKIDDLFGLSPAWPNEDATEFSRCAKTPTGATHPA